MRFRETQRRLQQVAFSCLCDLPSNRADEGALATGKVAGGAGDQCGFVEET